MTHCKDALCGEFASRCIARLVEDQAAIRPEATAVSKKNCTVTYRELNDRASLIAGELRRLGVGPDILVGMCMKSSVAMVVGALAVLKAGGAYLPLDPSFPRQRLISILTEAQPTVLMTAPEFDRTILSGPWKHLQLEEDGRFNGIGNPSVESAIHVSFHNLAYVIFTSGSTGEPKGVEIEHGSLINLIDWHRRTFLISPRDRATQIAGPGFDAAVWEIWPYLAAGASVHIPEEDVRLDFARLQQWLIDQEITISFLPTATAERVMNLDWPQNTKLHTLLTGADTLLRFPRPALPFTVVNNYGPTECAVVSTSGIVPWNADPHDRPTIGLPITNTHAYILDEYLQPVTMGTAGELFIAGAGVARGYRNRPDLTDQRFLTDPFVERAGARMYRTGDLVRMRSDGQLMFLGRLDNQVKIRGYRIELDEISAALNRHPDISQCTAAVREADDGERRLTGYIVTTGHAALTRSQIQEFLRAYLPDYMIPAVLVRVNELSLTPNGKVDMARLPEPSAENTIQDGASDQPASILEQRVASLLAELLEIDHIGRRDNFFHLGGHSLLGAQVIARVRDIFDVDLPLRSLFEQPTVEGISEEIERLILEKLDLAGVEDARTGSLSQERRTAA